MAEGGLRKWVAEKWVDIGAPKKNGKYQPCGRSKGEKRAYPKCYCKSCYEYHLQKPHE
jgi:hypothetical protein